MICLCEVIVHIRPEKSVQIVSPSTGIFAEQNGLQSQYGLDFVRKQLFGLFCKLVYI